MHQLRLTRKPPFVRLVDVGLQRQVDKLQQENESLKTRLTAAHQEKVEAQNQAEDLRKQKERLRNKVTDLKQQQEAQSKIRLSQEQKIQALRQEIETLKSPNAK